MQAFLPYADFRKSAQCLDNKRLGKQRIETWQIYQTLKAIKMRENGEFGDKTLCRIAWENHPIVKMWKGYEQLLLQYGYIITNEWIKRGFKDTMLEKFGKELINNYNLKPIALIDKPEWLGYEPFHKSHRAKLYWKSPEYYKLFKDDYNELVGNIDLIEPDYLWFIDGRWKIILKVRK